MRASSSSIPKVVLAVTLLAVIFCGESFAQQSAALLAAPQPLITQPVDEAQLTVLKGNTHPLARPEFDLGTAPATLPMQRMLLVLKRSAEQESALRKLLDDQQDKASPSYHKWLTPDEYGKQFGPTDADLQTITAWLQSHGFQVGSTKGRTVLEFSGSASQVREAFHTTIHKYVVNGEQHWANAVDPQIPAALVPAVAGVLTLHNFLKKPQIRISKKPLAVKVRAGKLPELTFSDGSHAMGPQDFATIYHSPAFNGGVTGARITVGVIGRSNLFHGGQDISDFAFNLFGCCGRFQIVLNGPDPGDLGGGEEAEATLDTTWSNAVAYGAQTDLVVSATTNTTDGIDLSEVFIIENNFADVMTESFSTCEAFSTSTQAMGVSALAEQAAAQGITYFVSTGDNGAEGCDDQNSETVATGPVSVNLLASTPFNVAVGGTVFNENGQSALYWSSSTSSVETALSYIPEDVWNDSCLASACGSGANIAAGSGGASTFFGKPSWQAGVTGILNDNRRDLPDVSLTAAIHDGYVLCLEGSCEPNAQGQLFIYLVGGTSASAPAFASIMALVDQQMANLNPAQGPRQGQADYVLYRLAASQNATLSQCNASNTTTLPATTCVFNDVTVGNNAVPGEVNYGLPDAQYQAGIGYDMATGLGSVNVANLVNQWNTVTFSPTSTSLLLNNTTSISIIHGQSVSVNISVIPSGTGTPTGDVSLTEFTNVPPFDQTSAGFFTLNGTGTVVSSTNQFSGGGGGSYGVVVHYAGDATYAPSDSSSVTVTVRPEPSTTTLSVLMINSQGTAVPFTSGPFGSFVYLRADVAGMSGYGTPSGTVTFTDTFGPIPGGNSFALNGGDQLNSGSNTATPNGVLNFDTGTHTISASYSGDTSFNPSNTTQSLSFTITPGFLAAVSPSAVNPLFISSPGSSGQTAVSVTTSTGFTAAISFSCSGLPSGAACQFSPSSITGTGTMTTTLTTITVTTMAPGAMLRTPGQSYFLAHWIAGGGLLFSMLLIGAPKQRRSRGFLLLLMIAVIVMAPACGSGGGGSQGPPPNPGTPKGTYNVVVNATSGSTTSTSGFTLVVQ
jgi:subtilase family serine protease